jgi:hypothetical protein
MTNSTASAAADGVRREKTILWILREASRDQVVELTRRNSLHSGYRWRVR